MLMNIQLLFMACIVTNETQLVDHKHNLTSECQNSEQETEVTSSSTIVVFEIHSGSGYYCK